MLENKNRITVVDQMASNRPYWTNPFVTSNTVIKTPKKTAVPKRASTKNVTKQKSAPKQKSNAQIKSVPNAKPTGPGMSQGKQPIHNQKFVYPIGQLDRIAGGFVGAQSAATACQHCEHMAKNFFHLQDVIRSGYNAKKPCRTCKACLQYLQQVNKNILSVFTNFGAIVGEPKDYHDKLLKLHSLSKESTHKTPLRKNAGSSSQRAVRTVKSKEAKAKPKTTPKRSSKETLIKQTVYKAEAKAEKQKTDKHKTDTAAQKKPAQSKSKVSGHSLGKSKKSKTPKKPRSGHSLDKDKKSATPNKTKVAKSKPKAKKQKIAASKE